MAKKRLSRLIGQVVIRANMADSRRKPFSALGFSYTMNISYNVTYSLMKIEYFLSEEDEAQEVCYITSVESAAG